jgi:malate synthase
MDEVSSSGGTGRSTGPGTHVARGHAGTPGRRLKVHGPREVTGRTVLTTELLAFLGDLDATFDARRRELLAARGSFRSTVAGGDVPDFLPETASVRESVWAVPPPPADLADRRVEITGPTDRKMIINALNSGARVYMADFEDAHAPTWAATLEGQSNLVDAVRREIEFVAPDGRRYALNGRTATLMVRPRGWHLDERHVTVDERPLSASLFDYGVYLYHNAHELLNRGTGPYFYLPKMEHYLEARLWNDVFRYSEEILGLPEGTIRATALIETLPAAFQMDEILFELREHSVGLNCGRWDYLFSFLKQFQDRRDVVFPDRDQLTMTTPFLTAYSRLLVRTCHRRGAHAMGGMAAQIPIKDDPIANQAAIAKVVADKEREVRAGHDGTWVAHPGLVPIATEVFDRGMPTPNQFHVLPPLADVRPAELLTIATGTVTEGGVRRNSRVALRYLASWLRGVGCVPIDHLMEDAATAEIARSELWTWAHHATPTQDAGPASELLVARCLDAEQRELEEELGGRDPSRSVPRARALLDAIVGAPQLAEFITVEAYRQLETAPEEDA